MANEKTIKSDNINNENNSTTYNSIDIVKLICALLIVTIHVSPFGYKLSTNMSFIDGLLRDCIARIAVPFFFVSTGFFLYKKKIKTGSNECIKKYIKKIFKLYIIWTIIYLPLIIYKLVISHKGISFSIVKFIRNFIFVGSYNHLWYLLATLYALVIILFLLKKNLSIKKCLVLGIVLYIIGLFGQSYLYFIMPLQYSAPSIWKILKAIQKIIYTTRNGLFEGLLFIIIGMICATYKKTLSNKKLSIQFLLFLGLMIIEYIVLKKHFDLKNCDMYVFLVPAVSFLFLLVSNIRINGAADKYKKVRILSSLVYFVHYGVKDIVLKIIKMFDDSLLSTPLIFLLVFLISILISILIIKISSKKRFSYLTNLYS